MAQVCLRERELVLVPTCVSFNLGKTAMGVVNSGF